MKKLIGSLAMVAVVTAPALAELSQPITIPQGAYTITPYGTDEVSDATRGISYTAGLYNNLTAPTRYSQNNANRFVGDDIHMVGPGSITGFQWVYVDGGPDSHSSSLAFFHNNAADTMPLLGNTVTFTSGTQVYGAVFNVTGLPQSTPGNPNGGWLITVNLPHLTTGADLWIGLATNSDTPTGGIGVGMRPGLRAGNAPTVGDSHDLYWSGFNSPGPYTTFYAPPASGGSTNHDWRFAVLPEPAAAGLLAVGALLALRRRRAA
jgi:MYXO-CTERM domain-containing protein